MDEPSQGTCHRGALQMSSSRKRYILVICDYATHYLEAAPGPWVLTPLPMKLVTFFSHIGLLEEITLPFPKYRGSFRLKQLGQRPITPIQMAWWNASTNAEGNIEEDGIQRRARLGPTTLILVVLLQGGTQASTWVAKLELLYRRNSGAPLKLREASKKSLETVVS